MIYKEPERITKEETDRDLLSTPAQAAEALIRAALWIDDPEWLKALLLKSLKDSRESVRDAALLSLGHIVRLQKFVSEASVEAIVHEIQPFLSDPKLRGRAEDTLGDIEVFRPGSRYRERVTITFGIRAKEQELCAVAEILREVLGKTFTAGENDLYGGTYYAADLPQGKIILQRNRDLLLDGAPSEPEWPIDELVLELCGEGEHSFQKEIHALETTQQIGMERIE